MHTHQVLSNPFSTSASGIATTTESLSPAEAVADQVQASTLALSQQTSDAAAALSQQKVGFSS